MATNRNKKYAPNPNDITINDLRIPGKRGPFWVRVLDYHESLEVLRAMDGKYEPILVVANVCLTNPNGRVYAADQIDNMVSEILPGPILLAIGNAAYRLNQFEQLAKQSETIEGATKN